MFGRRGRGTSRVLKSVHGGGGAASDYNSICERHEQGVNDTTQMRRNAVRTSKQ